MRPIRIAAQLHPQHGDYAALLAGALRAESLGYDILYTWDHFFPLYGKRDDAHLECWTLLAAWAQATERSELGPLVTCAGYRNAHLIADMARTIDRISRGRFILGLGSGWFERDYAEYGYPFGTVGSRLDVLAEALPEIRGRLRRLDPPPIRPMPILIAGTGERRTLRLVAEHADAWHAGFPESPAELEPAVSALRRWCSEAARDPESIEWSVGVEPYDLDRFLEADADTYLAMGFTQFTLGFDGPAWQVDAGEPWLRWRDAHEASTGAGLAASTEAPAG